MLEQNDKLYAAIAIVCLALITVLSPFPDMARLGVMATLCCAACTAERIL